MKYEDYVRDHQQYHTAHTECSEWIKMMVERLEMCTETTGDRYALQNRLERLEVSRISVMYRNIGNRIENKPSAHATTHTIY